MARREDADCYLPSALDILIACAEIRQGWSPEERRSRATGDRRRPRVETPVVPDPASARHEPAED